MRMTSAAPFEGVLDGAAVVAVEPPVAPAPVVEAVLTPPDTELDSVADAVDDVIVASARQLF